MKKIVAWVKKYGWIVFASVGGILAIILGVKHEKEKISKLKREVQVIKAKNDIVQYDVDKEAAKEVDKVLEKKDNQMDTIIEEDKNAIYDARKEAEELSGDDLVAELNRRYFN